MNEMKLVTRLLTSLLSRSTIQTNKNLPRLVQSRYSSSSPFATNKLIANAANEIPRSNKLIDVNFPDGSKESFHIFWLRDSCKCPQCINPKTKEKRLHPGDVDYTNLSPVDVSNDGKVLKVSWVSNDGQQHESRYDLNWLNLFKGKFNCGADGCNEYPADGVYRCQSLPGQVSWDSKTINETKRRHDYQQVMSSDEDLVKLLQDIIVYGIGFIQGAPLERGTVLQIARRIAYERVTGYGSTFDVTADPDPKAHFSYSSAPLDLHTDLCYRERVPGVQMLHTIQSANKGGESCFTDGLHCAKLLRQNNPQLFELLTRPVMFSFLDSQRGIWFREKWPIIVMDGGIDGFIKEINLSYFSMRAPLLPHNQMEMFYTGFKEFCRLLRSQDNSIRLKLANGDIAIFNNRRVLHGRTGYDAVNDRRLLEGCYMDLDEISALYDKLSSPLTE